jgi:phage tail-like protein
MPDNANTEAKTFLANLPAIYQEEETHGKPLHRFLSAFEQVLLGYEDGSQTSTKRRSKREAARPHVEGLGEKIAHLYELFDPRETPENFLPWLGSWVALSIRANLSVPKQRKLIANLIPLYRIRGTRAYMEQLLELCVDAGTSVSEDEIPPFQIGVRSTLGTDTYIGGGPPHFFRVKMVASEMGALEVQAQRQIAYEVIELAKPAHTVYDFVVISPQMQVGVHSTVGVDTVLGSAAAQLP